MQDTRDGIYTISGSRGSVFYGGTDPVTGVRYKALAIREEGTDFASLVCKDASGHTKDVSDFYIDTTPMKGDLIVAPEGYFFSAFTLTAGSVAAT